MFDSVCVCVYMWIYFCICKCVCFVCLYLCMNFRTFLHCFRLSLCVCSCVRHPAQVVWGKRPLLNFFHHLLASCLAHWITDSLILITIRLFFTWWLKQKHILYSWAISRKHTKGLFTQVWLSVGKRSKLGSVKVNVLLTILRLPQWHSEFLTYSHPQTHMSSCNATRMKNDQLPSLRGQVSVTKILKMWRTVNNYNWALKIMG